MLAQFVKLIKFAKLVQLSHLAQFGNFFQATDTTCGNIWMCSNLTVMRYETTRRNLKHYYVELLDFEEYFLN